MSSEQIRVVGVGGSLAAHSNSLAALKIALEAAEAAGASTTLFDIRELALPMYSPDIPEVPESVRAFCDTAWRSDGMLWSSPLYNGTISGSFKNALDWFHLLGDREPAYLTDKVIGLISTAGGTQGLQAVNTMEFVVRALRGWAVPLVIPIPQAWRVFDKEGHASDERVAEQLQSLGREVTRAAAQFAARQITTPDAERAQAQLGPLSEKEGGS